MRLRVVVEIWRWGVSKCTRRVVIVPASATVVEIVRRALRSESVTDVQYTHGDAGRHAKVRAVKSGAPKRDVRDPVRIAHGRAYTWEGCSLFRLELPTRRPRSPRRTSALIRLAPRRGVALASIHRSRNTRW